MSASAGGDAPLPAPKEDPETLVLRGRPRPVVRFRRGLIVGAAALASVSLVAIAWLALEPPSFGPLVQEEAPRLNAKAPEALANAPVSYGDAPRLGPPLPGDLGRPILAHRRRLEEEAAPADGAPPQPGDAAAVAAEAERQRLAAELKAARESGLIVQLRAERAAPAPAPESGSSDGAAEASTSEAERGLGGGEGRRAFAPAPLRKVNPHAVSATASLWLLSAGTVIPASLITGLNSDLPGFVSAQVTQNVLDSATGRAILIPQGARLIGSYDSRVGSGQRRALLVWQRIIFPDGSSVALDNVPATDPSGNAGLRGKVDTHGWRLLKGIALATLLGVGGELGFGGESDIARAVRESAQQEGSRAGEKIVERHLDVPPTLIIRPGTTLRAVLHQDLVLKPWTGGRL